MIVAVLKAKKRISFSQMGMFGSEFNLAKKPAIKVTRSKKAPRKEQLGFDFDTPEVAAKVLPLFGEKKKTEQGAMGSRGGKVYTDDEGVKRYGEKPTIKVTKVKKEREEEPVPTQGPIEVEPDEELTGKYREEQALLDDVAKKEQALAGQTPEIIPDVKGPYKPGLNDGIHRLVYRGSYRWEFWLPRYLCKEARDAGFQFDKENTVWVTDDINIARAVSEHADPMAATALNHFHENDPKKVTLTYTKDKDRYEVVQGYDPEMNEKLKSAGFDFSWDGKRWITHDTDKALLFREYSDNLALDMLKDVKDPVEASRALDSDIDVPAPEGLEYRGYQKAGIDWMDTHEGSYLADEMGTGKTIQVLGLLNKDPSLKKTLLIVPASLKENWRIEGEKWLVEDKKIHVAYGSKAIPEDADIVVANFEILTKHPELKEKKWDLVAIDEIHKAKTKATGSAQSQRHAWIFGGEIKKKAVKPIAARKRIAISGTPIPNSPAELYGALTWLDPHKWGGKKGWTKYHYGFCDAFKESIGYGRYATNRKGSSNLAQLQKELRSRTMIRRIKSDVLKDLPPKVRKIIEIKTSTQTLKKISGLEKAVDKFRSSLGAGADPTVATSEEEYHGAIRGLKEGQMVAFDKISKTRAIIAKQKTPYVIDRLQDYGDDKVIVFAHHHDMIDSITKEMDKKDLGYVVLTGKTPAKRRQQVVKVFQDDPSIQYFVGQTHAAGVGITLTASSHVVFAEPDWVPANIVQAEDRAHRIGAEGHDMITVDHIVWGDSMESTMIKTAVGKQDVADRALDVRAPKTPHVEGEHGSLPSGAQTASPGQIKGYALSKENKAALSGVDAERFSSAHTRTIVVTNPGKKTIGRTKKTITIPERFSPEQQSEVHNAIRALSMACDGAFFRDEQGFSKFDTKQGKYLANLHIMTQDETAMAYSIAKKYPAQVHIGF